MVLKLMVIYLYLICASTMAFDDFLCPLHEAIKRGAGRFNLQYILKEEAKSSKEETTFTNIINDRNTRGHSALHIAVQGNNYDACEYLIEVGAKLETVDNLGRTPLICATQENNLRIVNLLLEKGADTTHEDCWNRNALHWASKDGFADVMEALVLNSGKRVKMNAVDFQGWTNFHFAASGNHVGVIDILYYTEGKRNRQENQMSLTPLHLAIREGQTEAAFTLMSKVEIGEVITKEGQTYAHYAARYGRTSIFINLLSKIDDMEKTDYDGFTLFLIAVASEESNIDIVRILIILGADILAVNRYNESAQGLALYAGNHEAFSIVRREINFRRTRETYADNFPLHFEIKVNQNLNHVRELLSREQLDVDAVDHLGRAAIHFAVQTSNAEIVRELISYKCDLYVQDVFGNNVLHLTKTTEMVRVLLNEETGLANVTNKIGNLPLHTAIYDELEEVVEILAGATADIAVYNFEGESPLDAAAKIGNIRIAEHLLKYGAGLKNKPTRSPLFFSAMKGDVEMTNLLIKNGMDIRVKDVGGITPAHLAVDYGKNLELVRTLLKDAIPATSKFGYTLLHYAAISKGIDPGMIRMLIKEYKVPLEAETFCGRVALYMAAKRGHTQTVKTLIDHGADILKKTPFGRSPLEGAVRACSPDCVSILMRACNGREVLMWENEWGFTPLEYLLSFRARSYAWELMTAIELTPDYIPETELSRYVRVLSLSFSNYVSTLEEIVPFKDYVQRAIEDFQRDNHVTGGMNLLKSYVENAFGIFYSLIVVSYPRLAFLLPTTFEYCENRREKLRRETEKYEAATEKSTYMKDLRYMLVESFMNPEGRKRLHNTYVDFLPLELIDDAFIGVANNGDIWQRMEIVANSLTFALNGRHEIKPHREYLSDKMARLSEGVIPRKIMA